MSEKSTLETKPEAQIYEIPIEEFEINGDKKDKIINLLKNRIKLTYEDYKKCEDRLKDDIKNQNINDIQYLIDGTVEIEEFRFKVDKIKKTAILIGIKPKNDEITLPRAIRYDSEDFIITSITSFSIISQMNVKILRFSSDTEIRTINSRSFCYTPITYIYIPPSLTELQPGCFQSCERLKNIEISPLNKNYLFYEGKYLLGKTDPKSDIFDVLLFVTFDVVNAIIPSNIKIIEKSAFFDTKNLKSVVFQPDSELQKICENAFSFSPIKQITIPQHVSLIEKFAFSNSELQSIEIPMNSELISIQENAFSNTKISKIFLPQYFNEMKEKWFSNMKNLTDIKISPLNHNFTVIDKFLLCKSDSKSNDFDVLLFSFSNARNVSIPSCVKVITPFLFYDNKKIGHVNFSIDSELQIIGEKAFSKTRIDSIFIPKHVTTIEKSAFKKCECLHDLRFAQNSELKIIGEKAFKKTKIESIFIPQHVSVICKEAFIFCFEVKSIKFADNSELKTIGRSAFHGLFHLKKIKIPKSVIEIGESAFYTNNDGDHLEVIEFHEDSELVEIKYNAFVKAQIKELIIPKHVKSIGSSTFEGCKRLKNVIIPEDSELQIIDGCAFSNTSIEKFYIPQHVTKLGSLLNRIRTLKKIEISPLNKNFILKENKYLFGKTDINSDVFDVLIYAKIDIKEVIIPSNVKIILPYVFNECSLLQKVVIPNDSQLQSIWEYAFGKTRIRSFWIPPKVTAIGFYAFENCDYLIILEIPENIGLKKISTALEFSSCWQLKLMVPANTK